MTRHAGAEADGERDGRGGDDRAAATFPSAPDAVIERVLGPIGLQRFTTEYREHRALHVARGDASNFAGLPTPARIERLLSTAELSFPDVQLVRAADPIAPASYTDDRDRIVPLRLVAHHAAGATLVISRAHRLFGSLADLCRGAGIALGAHCRANLYLTPAGSQGFAPHYDAHDVLILQLEGRKSFRFHAGGAALPLPDQRFDAATSVCGEQGDELMLEPGDTLYIPRGVMHDAAAGDGGPSLHVTLGVYMPSVHELLEATLRVAAERDVALRRAAWWTDRGMTDGVDGGDAGGALRALLDGAFSAANVREARARLADELAIDATPDCAGLLSRGAADSGPALGSILHVRAQALAAVERRGGIVTVRMPGQAIDLDEPMASAVEALLAGGGMRVGELPGLDDGQRSALARQLLEQGLVTIDGPVAPDVVRAGRVHDDGLRNPPQDALPE